MSPTPIVDLGDESNLPAVLRGINDVKNFYVAHRDSRFKRFNNSNEPIFHIRNIAGYLYTYQNEKFVLFTKLGIIEACNGHDYQFILKELKQRKMLLHESGKLTKKFTLPDIGRQTLYAIKLSFINDDFSK